MKKKVVLILVILLFGCSSTEEVDQSIDLIVPSGNTNSDAEEAAGLPSAIVKGNDDIIDCLLYTSPSPRDKRQSRMPSSA